MVNVTKLNKDYEDILLGLTGAEITEYYIQLNKKIVNCYPSLTSNWNEEELGSLLTTVEDTTNILKRSYTLDSLNKTNMASRYLELGSKYLNEIDVAVIKLTYYRLLAISYNIAHTLRNISFFLISLYNNYTYLTDLKKIDEATVLDNEKDSVYVEPINTYIRVSFKELESNINFFKNHFSEMAADNPEDVTEDVVNEINDYNGLYSICSSYVEDFEDLIVNPFKKAIEIDVEVNIEHSSRYTEEDYDKLLEEKIAVAPKYNFETFELIVPEGVNTDG